MSMTRKQFGRLALASVLATTVAGTALAQTASPSQGTRDGRVGTIA